MSISKEKYVDILLDKVERFGSKTLTKNERMFLDNIDNEKHIPMLKMYNNLWLRYNYLYDMSLSYLSEMMDVNELVLIKYANIWDNLEQEDSSNFCIMYNIHPCMIDMKYETMDIQAQLDFEEYLYLMYGIVQC